MRFILDGGAGNDLLHGGQGNDTLSGGAGTNRFAFSGQNGTDTIVDFQGGADVRVDLGAKVADAGTIVLLHTQLAAINSSDFAFS